MLKQIHIQLRKALAIVAISLLSVLGSAQSVSFELKTSPNIHFDFDAVADYINGITYMNAFTLNIDATGTQWDLYVGATTTVPGMMDVTSTYALGGANPPVSLIELQFRNTSNTSLQSGFFSLTDISSPTYIIGSAAAPDAAVACGSQGANQAGNYLANPACYQFKVDLRIVPGLTYRPGLYTVRIDYIIVQDL